VLLAAAPLPVYPRHELARRVAYVPQVHREAFAYTVEDVVLMGRMPYLSFFSTTSARDREIALASMERLDILHLKDRAYTEVSGGERQLALIARALTQGADTLVMDEPANGLDFGNQIRLLDQIASLARDGYTFVMSTHFPDHALWISDHVVMLQKGLVVADGDPDTVMSEEAIFRLYNTEVSIFTFNGSSATCIPRSVLRKGRNGKKLHQQIEMKSLITTQDSMES
jgi:iron complex transport system ATP-binding protein